MHDVLALPREDFLLEELGDARKLLGLVTIVESLVGPVLFMFGAVPFSRGLLPESKLLVLDII